MARKTKKDAAAAKRKQRRRSKAGRAGGHAKGQIGNPSYAGYEYQIGVTVWSALELMLAKGVTDALTIEPKSHEDIEAAVAAPDKASLALTTPSGPFKLIVQVKSRSTEPWTTKALADVLAPQGSDPGGRVRPLEMLTSDPECRYVFVTNESLSSGLRPHAGEHLLDFPEVKSLPPYARKGFDAAAQLSMGSRLLLCAGLTVEVLEGRIARLLTLHGHVPTVNHPACTRDLRDEIRRRIAGHASGLWTKTDLLTVLAAYGGSVLPTRTMDHYVRPRSYEAICERLESRHAVVIAGPSGTGKTLTADVIEVGFRRSETPFYVVSEEYGPSRIRSELTRTEPVLFHLRDPWGSNRLTPEADRWSGELPKLIRNAGPGRKFLITSRSDVLLSAGHDLTQQLAPYIVTIEIEDYGRDRLAAIYDGISSDLAGHAATLAKAHRARALRTLTRPYEIDRFLVALSREDPAHPHKLDEILADSQVEAISRVIAAQIRGWSDGAASAAILWAMLVARGAVAANIFPRLLRRLRVVDSSLRPNVDGLIDFLVAGRNLRRDVTALTFYHPRVEDGLRLAMLQQRGEAEHVLSKLADALVALDQPGDWGTETVLGILRAIGKLDGVELSVAPATQDSLDAYLEAAVLGPTTQTRMETALEDMARYGSVTHVPSRVARMLINGEPDTSEVFTWHSWRTPVASPEEVAALSVDPRAQAMLEHFIRKVLPFSRTHYGPAVAEFLAQFGFDLRRAFSDAFETIASSEGDQNVDAVVTGLLNGDQPDFDGVIDRIAKIEAEVDVWLETEYRIDARQAEEHEVDAALADRIIDEPQDRFYIPRASMTAAVQVRRAREGVEWVWSHPHRQLIMYALADLIGNRQGNPPPQELRQLLKYAEGWVRPHAWWAAAQHWAVDLDDLLETTLAQTGLPNDLRRTLMKIVATTGKEGTDPVSLLTRVAGASSTARRIELICDVMAARFIPELEADRRTAQHQIAERLVKALPPPENELAKAVAGVLDREDITKLAKTLSAAARLLMSDVLPNAPAGIARPMVCLAAACGIDPIPTAERLLGTGEAEDGEAAVLSLRIDGKPDTVAVLFRAFKHGRYPVRRDALRNLVEKVGPDGRANLLAAAEDKSAEIRLAWANLMEIHRWPEAIESLVELLKDRRDFSSERAYGGGAILVAVPGGARSSPRPGSL